MATLSRGFPKFLLNDAIFISRLSRCGGTRSSSLQRLTHNHRKIIFSEQGNIWNLRMSSPLTLGVDPRALVNGNLESKGTEGFYESAVRKLNSLQSNAATIRQSMEDKTITREASVPGTIRFLKNASLSLDQLDTLNVVHVSGTKGKGTTCAFVESILRFAGLKTGFYSSPHLVKVRERIRINGEPIPEEMFAQYFFKLYNGINKTDAPPAYFRFLTCMAYYIFYHEKVDVAVIEVGIGGTFDSTNIMRRPVVVGITSLGLEHQHILGSTLEQISVQKAGIMKENTPAFTVSTHPDHITEILRTHASNVKCPFYVAPPLEDFKESNSKEIVLGVDDGRVSRLNASLAIQLATTFLREKFPEKLKNLTSRNPEAFEPGRGFPLSPFILKGLANCRWRGRFEVLPIKENLTFYLDGAHTTDSLSVTRNWFLNSTSDKSLRVLIFYITGCRDAKTFLRLFAESRKFDLALFCPLIISNNAAYTNTSGATDNWSVLRDEQDVMEVANEMAKTWESLQEPGMGQISKALVFQTIEEVKRHLELLSSSLGSDSVNNEDWMTGKEGISVLITGSLHLVGTWLSVLGPEV